MAALLRYLPLIVAVVLLVAAVVDIVRIDPSRASRLVAGLVQQGFLMRAVSQQDGRRAVLLRSGRHLGVCLAEIAAEIQQAKRHSTTYQRVPKAVWRLWLAVPAQDDP